MKLLLIHRPSWLQCQRHNCDRLYRPGVCDIYSRPATLQGTCYVGESGSIQKHLSSIGMHLLLSYVGCIGSLMAGSGIVEVLSEAFGGVLKILTGKKYPENVRALRMLVEEILRPLFDQNNLECMDDHHITEQPRSG